MGGPSEQSSEGQVGQAERDPLIPGLACFTPLDPTSGNPCEKSSVKKSYFGSLEGGRKGVLSVISKREEGVIRASESGQAFGLC